VTTGFSRRTLLRRTLAAASLYAAGGMVRGQFVPPLRRPPVTGPVAPRSIEVTAHPLPAFDRRDPGLRRFGRLTYRSGLVLTSSDRQFGGLSAIRVDAAGERFIALSDHGWWFTGRIDYAGGVLAGLKEVEAAPLLNKRGWPIWERPDWYDSESIAIDGSVVYVGLERVGEILRYDFARGFTQARGEIVRVPHAVNMLPENKGLEGMVFVPRGGRLGGTLLAFSERGLDAEGNLMAFLIGGPGPGQFAVRRSADFDISDAVLLPSGEVLILERKFFLSSGLDVRIRSLALASIAPGALVDGEVIFAASLAQHIDNMEGIAVHVSAQGETVLTLVSDNNFSVLQRNLLLQFTLT